MPPAPEQVLFAHVVGRSDDDISLDVAALIAGAWEYPDLDVAHYVSLLDGFADMVRDIAPSEQGKHPTLRALHRTLFDRLGFRGNQDQYYDPRNSFLNEVIDRRVGIPISLSIVYIEVARRCGLRVAGVNFPGHFLVRYDGEGEVLVVDPFHLGLMLDERELVGRLRRVSGPRAALAAEHLRPADKKAILGRMLANLASIYKQNGDAGRSVAVLERMLILEPRNTRYERELERMSRLAGNVN